MVLHGAREGGVGTETQEDDSQQQKVTLQRHSFTRINRTGGGTNIEQHMVNPA